MNHFAQTITPGGYKCEEVASALQKCIRRGLESAALYWATELDLAGFGEYVWKRLRIISSEDIGAANPAITIEIRALYENWKDLRKKGDARHAPERLFLVDAVIRLSRSTKSREVDHALIVHYEGQRPKQPIPDFALDRHTSRGRRLGRGYAHFFDEGAKLYPKSSTDQYERQARAIRRDHGTQAELPT